MNFGCLLPHSLLQHSLQTAGRASTNSLRDNQLLPAAGKRQSMTPEIPSLDQPWPHITDRIREVTHLLSLLESLLTSPSAPFFFRSLCPPRTAAVSVASNL